MIADVNRADAAVEHPPPGRPRDPHADEVIVAAAADVLAESGPSGFTVDAVAAHAGVGKATIYRRWSSKVELLLAVSQQAAFELEAPNTGSLRDDLVIHMTQLADKFRTTMAGKVLLALLAEAAGNPEMRELLARFMEERRQRVIGIVNRGIERGELPPDTDVHLLLDLLGGPIFLRVFFTQLPVDETLVKTTVDIVLRGVTSSS